jgi:RHS repeat-associated protein
MTTEVTTSQLSIDLPLNGSGLLRPLSSALSFYDGDAYEGLPYGQIGDHGAVVRTKSLVIRNDQINEAYGDVKATDWPECFQDTPGWSSYPTDFKDNLQNDDDRLGFVEQTTAPYSIGWYRTDVKNKYDFQDTSAPLSVPRRGLVVMSKDCFDNQSEIIYDDYAFLPIEARQYYDNTTPKYLSTTALYDYRLFKPIQVSDENENRSRFDYSPLGLLKGIALIGQSTKTEGDIVTNDPLVYVPSTTFEYDLMEFYDSHKPVWVKTIQREEHWQDDPSYDSPTIQKVEYSDGFGRILQSRAQAEDTLFGPTSGVGALTGDSGLPVDQGSNADSVGRIKAVSAADNVVVSGWKVYNNKGKVVEEYEPFFSSGYTYQSAKSTKFLLQKMTIRYDAGGRPTETTFPDGSKSLVVYGKPNNIGAPPMYGTSTVGAFSSTPWERYAYDQNDLAPLTTSGSGDFAGAFTPKSELIDALGRTIKTTEHKSQATANVAVFEDVVMTYKYDIQGNLITVHDPMGRQVFNYRYNLQKQPLYTNHIDSGISRVIPDALGKPIQADDAKEAQTLSRYDRLQRPLMGWAKDGIGIDIRLTSNIAYGDEAPSALLYNRKGKPYEAYDEAGRLRTSRYDFKGNLLRKSRWVLNIANIKSAMNSYEPDRIDWTGGSSGKLDSTEYQTDNEYDALNRITQLTLPEDVDTNRKTIVPEYNRAGALEKVSYNSTEYVSNIAYNAKGQRLLIAFGNGIMTRYAYDPITFRLLRQRSENYLLTSTSSTTTYTPNSGNRQDDAYDYDLVGNILDIVSAKTGCGIGGTDSLTRSFTYDPLYRLQTATGRENVPGSGYPFPGWSDTTRSTDNNTTVGYTRKYTYDKIGNIEQIRQIGTNAFTRDFNYTESSGVKVDNMLDSVDIGANSYSYTYDVVGNQTVVNTERKFEWDAANRLLFFKNQAGSSEPSVEAQYCYDSGGNRVMKVVRKSGGGYEIRIYIDGVFEYYTDETDEQNTVHIMDDQSRIATVRIGAAMGDITPAVKYVLENNIGSSMVTMDETAAWVSEQEYYPFGETSFGSYGKKRYQYVGKERDDESGMYYYGARYYSPWIARFISVDPLAAKYPNLSGYLYAYNNPIKMNDPTGMEAENAQSGGGADNMGGDAKGDTSTKGESKNVTSTTSTDSKTGETATTHEYKDGGKVIDSGKDVHAQGDYNPETREHTTEGRTDSDPNTEYDGDSVYGMSKRYNTTVDDIYSAEQNAGLREKVESGTLQPGDKVYIPDSKAKSSSSESTPTSDSHSTSDTSPNSSGTPESKKNDPSWLQKNQGNIKAAGRTIGSIFSAAVKGLGDDLISWGSKAAGIATKLGGKALGALGGALTLGLGIHSLIKNGADAYNISDIIVGAALVALAFTPVGVIGLAAMFVGGIAYGLIRSTVFKAKYE